MILPIFLSKEKKLVRSTSFMFREMQAQADRGEQLEKQWYSKLYDYQSKYPQEAVEFKCLLYNGMLPGWENSLPVIYPSRHDYSHA